MVSENLLYLALGGLAAAALTLVAALFAALKSRDSRHAKAMREKEEAVERLLGEKEKAFAESVRTLREQFANLAAQTLRAQSGDLARANSQQIESALRPLREQVEALKSATVRTQAEHAKLAESIGRDVGRIGDVARELAGVSDALSSNS